MTSGRGRAAESVVTCHTPQTLSVVTAVPVPDRAQAGRWPPTGVLCRDFLSGPRAAPDRRPREPGLRLCASLDGGQRSSVPSGARRRSGRLDWAEARGPSWSWSRGRVRWLRRGEGQRSRGGTEGAAQVESGSPGLLSPLLPHGAGVPPPPSSPGRLREAAGGREGSGEPRGGRGGWPRPGARELLL